MADNEGTWASWCKYVLYTLEHHEKALEVVQGKVTRWGVFIAVVQAQIIIGAVALGYLIKTLVDHISR